MEVGSKSALVLVGLAAIVVAGLLVGPESLLGQAQALLDSPWFPVFLVGLYLVRPLLGWPITALSALVGYKYGIALGVPVALLGAVGSTFIAYAAMRYLDLDSGLLGRASDGSTEFFSQTGELRGMISARVAPVPSEATSLAAGAADIHPSRFVLGTAIGEIPWAVAAVTIGHSMHRLTLSDVSFSPWLIAATAVAAVLVIAGPVYRRLSGAG